MVYKFGIIGNPLSHSLSKVMQEAAFKSLDLQGSYDVLETKSEDLIQRIKFLKTNNYDGFNVTIPHKVPITVFLSEVDDVANMAGSVNTVLINEDKTLKGFNTDVYGFMKPIDDIDLNGKKAAVLGTGGASRAVVCGLSLKGISKIDMFSRNVINSSDAVNTLKERFKDIEIKLLQYEILSSLKDVDIVVNTTPLGMKNFDEENSPLDDKQVESLPNNAIIYDIVYNPLRTALISKAIRYNKKFICGLDMLVWQACYAMNIWCGQMPDFNTLKISALEEFLLYQN